MNASRRWTGPGPPYRRKLYYSIVNSDTDCPERWQLRFKLRVFARCNAPQSPWFVIPADHKWYRDAAMAGIVLETFREMDPRMPPVDVDLGEIRALYERELAELNGGKR